MNKAKMALFARSSTKDESGMELLLINPDHACVMGDEDIKVGEVEASYTPPGNLNRQALLVMAVNTLKDKQERVIAEAYKQKMELQDKIDKLLMLGHDPL